MTPQGAIVPNKEALVRSHLITVFWMLLEQVGILYRTQRHLSSSMTMCMAGDMEMHTAGSLKNGQMVWALAKTKESFELFNGDQ